MYHRKRVIVSGEVQGVFYRDTCRAAAEAQGVNGWVRNLPDGRVEAVFEGDTGVVEQLVDWAREGPPTARVEKVEEFDEEPQSLTTFEVRSTPPAEPASADAPDSGP